MLGKRSACLFLATVLILSLFFALPLSAANNDKWEYTVTIRAANEKNAEAKGAKNAITAKLKFSSGTITGQFDKCDKKNVDTSITVTTTNAPWSLKKLGLKNTSGDGYKLYHAKITAKCIGGDNYNSFKNKTYEDILDYYPEGQRKDNKGGEWLHSDEYEMTVNTQRKVTAAGDFDTQFVRKIYVGPKDSNTTIEKKWNGKLSDQYGTYTATNESDAPTFELDSVIGRTGKGAWMQKSDLKNFGIEETKTGYKYNPKKLYDKMEAEGMNGFFCQLIMYVDGKGVKVQPMYLIRNVFDYSSVSFQDTHYEFGGNKYYTDGSRFSNKSAVVKVNFTIKEKAAQQMYYYNAGELTGKEFKYSEAYLDTAAGKIYANKVNGENKATLTENRFTLTFNIPKNADTAGAGIRLVIKGGALNIDGAQFKYWDESEKSYDMNKLYGNVKIDAKNPSLEITAQSGATDSGKGWADYNKENWYKSVKLTLEPDETIYKETSYTYNAYNAGYNKAFGENTGVLMLVDSGRSNVTSGQYKIKSFAYDPTGTTANAGAYQTQDVPLAKDYSQPVMITLADSVEGEFDLVVRGEDVAGNKLYAVYKGLKLDNKAPEVNFVKAVKGTKSDPDTGVVYKNISNEYHISMEEASNTGTLYYMFTDKSVQAASEVPLDTSAGKSEGNEYTSLIGKWQMIEQKDIPEGKNAVATITLAENEKFSGRLVYYAVDACGNKSEYKSVEGIEMKNESTAYEISPSDVAEGARSYEIKISAGENKVYYRWKKLASPKDIYLFEDYREYKGSINTENDPETRNLNGQYYLDVKIVTPSSSAVVYAKAYYNFDNEGPEIRVTPSSDAEYLSEQSVTVSVTDKGSGVLSGSVTAKVVNPDGSDIEGAEIYNIPVTDKSVEKAVLKLDYLESGVYALKVTASDALGNTSYSVSDKFFVRNGAPEGKIEVTSEYSHADFPLLSDDETVAVLFDITENFKNISAASKQKLYYRIGQTEEKYGAWTVLGDMTADESGYGIKETADVKGLTLSDGLNILYVQTLIYPDGYDLNKIGLNNVKEEKLYVYFDSEAPKASMLIDDEHTTKTVIGYLKADDNSTDFGGTLTAKCDNESVTIGAYQNGAFEITVSENVTDETVFVYDEAKNETKVVFTIEGIDKEAPCVKITANAKEGTGARLDAEATVTVSEMAEDKNAEFALIPAGDLTDGKIADKYFKNNLENPDCITVEKLRSENAKWDGECNNTYKLTVAGITGDWYIGVRATDALGNTVDYVQDAPISTVDAEIGFAKTDDGKDKWSVSPEKAENMTVVTVNFNVPVYMLSPDKVVKGNDEDNLELAKSYALVYSETASFVISEVGTYYLYAVDSLGRGKELSLTVPEGAVEFGASGDVKTKLYEWIEVDDGEGNFTRTLKAVDSDKTVCAALYDTYVLEVAPVNEDTLLLPNMDLDDVFYDNTYRQINGFDFNFDLSDQYAVDWEGKSTNYQYGKDDSGKGNVKGYKKLIYNVEQVVDVVDYIETPAETQERIIEVRAFNKDNDPTNSSHTTLNYLVVPNIDNTAPITKWSVSPEVLKLEMKEFEYGDGIEYYEDWVINPTPGDVTLTITAQDKESGIGNVTALAYYESYDDESFKEIVVSPDENGYWCWDGADKQLTVFDKEQYASVTYDSVPVKIEYYDYPVEFESGDIYGVKTLKYTFTDEFDLSYMKGFYVAIFENTLGGSSSPSVANWEGGFSTEGMIYKMEIEEGKDYKLSYRDKEGTAITDIETGFYNDAEAVIEILDRGTERELYIVNNSGKKERSLNVYQRDFEFKLKDKYGYTKTVPVKLENVDLTPGSVDVIISESGKTNKPITVLVTAYDDESGLKSVSVSGTKEVTLTEVSDGVYSGAVSENGTYAAVMYDNAGNRSVKAFTVTNINTEVPTAQISYSCGAKQWADGDKVDFYTSRPVTATLSFSKPNVKITSVEEFGLTASDYTVNYGTGAIVLKKSGSLGVWFTDDYGNIGQELVTVENINATPPTVTIDDEATYLAADKSYMEVGFKKYVVDIADEREKSRTEQDIFVSYGGMTQAVANEDGTKNVFRFYKNGDYSFKVYDKEGLSSTLNVTVSGIDKSAPEITKVVISYFYDEYNEETGAWELNKKVETEITPTKGTVGYRIGQGYSVTNKDVTVDVTTNDPTSLIGGEDEYEKTHTRVYEQNGMYTFNVKKENNQTAQYGVDVQVIDKEPPTIDLKEAEELIFYENAEMNETTASLEELIFTFEAYDEFMGVKTVLTDKVTVTWDEDFNPYDLSANVFDSSKPYTVTYTVTDSANNKKTVTRTVRLVGVNDTVVLVNGSLPGNSGKSTVYGDTVKLALKNFSGTAYVSYQKGVKTMGQMKKSGTIINADSNGEYCLSGLSEGWYTFYIQTDKREYFTLGVYVTK